MGGYLRAHRERGRAAPGIVRCFVSRGIMRGLSRERWRERRGSTDGSLFGIGSGW